MATSKEGHALSNHHPCFRLHGNRPHQLIGSDEACSLVLSENGNPLICLQRGGRLGRQQIREQQLAAAVLISGRFWTPVPPRPPFSSSCRVTRAPGLEGVVRWKRGKFLLLDVLEESHLRTYSAATQNQKTCHLPSHPLPPDAKYNASAPQRAIARES